MNHERVRVGIIGCGALAQSVHIPILSRLKAAEVTALADNHVPILEKARQLVPAARLFTDGRELISSGAVDAVVIATPASSHAWFAVAAFEQHLHVYLEKPIAIGIEDATAILDAARVSDRTGMIGFNYRFNPLYRRLCNVASAQEVISTDSLFRIPRSGNMGWRSERSSGGGALLDLASHHIDLVRFLTGDEIHEVTAILRSVHSDQDLAVLDCVTANGARCHIKAEYGDSFAHTFKITTRASTYEIDLARSHTVDENGRQNRFPSPSRLAHIFRKIRSPANEPSYGPALNAFLDSARCGITVSPDLRDGFEALLVTAAAENSASSGSPVAVRLA